MQVPAAAAAAPPTLPSNGKPLEPDVIENSHPARVAVFLSLPCRVDYLWLLASLRRYARHQKWIYLRRREHELLTGIKPVYIDGSLSQ